MSDGLKRGLIFPRSGMGNVYYAQGLPRIYAQLAPNLKELYDFSERTGPSCYDLAGTQTATPTTAAASGDNTSVAAMWANSNAGGIDCDGTNDYITIYKALQAWVDIDKAHTMEAWIRYDANPNPYGIIMGDGVACPSGKYNILNWRTLYVAAGTFKIEYVWYRYNGSEDYINFARSTNTTAYTTGMPYHIVITHNGTVTTAGMASYINGAADALTSVINETTAASVWHASYMGAMDMALMGQKSNASYCTNGEIYKWAIYDKALSATEVATLYNYEKMFMR